MCKVTNVMHLEQFIVSVKTIDLNPTCSVGYIFPVVVAGGDVVLSHAISPGYGG